jgi:hypothetical protein
VLRRILVPKGEEVAGNWRRLHSEELRNLFASPYVLKVEVKVKVSLYFN